jgi:hypothetical protein
MKKRQLELLEEAKKEEVRQPSKVKKPCDIGKSKKKTTKKKSPTRIPEDEKSSIEDPQENSIDLKNQNPKA